MPASAQGRDQHAKKAWLFHLGALLAAVFLLVGMAYVHLFVRLVPPISGTVVDAITGQPIRAISVCLRVDAEGMGRSEVLRTEKVKTDDSGEFAFRPSIHDLAMLTEWRGYSVRLTDPRNDMAAPCGSELGPGLNETHPDQAIHEVGYFPVVLVGGTGSSGSFRRSSTRRPMGSTTRMKVPLLPVLSVPDECSQVGAPQLARDCRQLVTEITAASR